MIIASKNEHFCALLRDNSTTPNKREVQSDAAILLDIIIY